MHADSINSNQPYKTLLVSNTDNAWFVLKEMLEKYDIRGCGPEEFALFQITVRGDTGKVTHLLLLEKQKFIYIPFYSILVAIVGCKLTNTSKHIDLYPTPSNIVTTSG